MIKMFSISDTQEIVDKAGRASEIAYQRTKAMKELKRDAEFAIFASAATVEVTGSTGEEASAPKMVSVNGWQVNVVGQTGSVGGGSVGSGNGTTATLGEATFNAEIQRAWDNGARISTVYTGGSLKRLISGWGTTANTRPRDGGQGTRLVNVVDFYLTDFGEVEVVLDRYVASSQMFLLDDSLWRVANLVPTREADIAKTGLAKNVMIWNQWTIEARNPTGNAMLWSKP